MQPYILVVEDEPELAALEADYLRAAGYRAETIDDGAAALAAIRRAPPDLLVLDLMLPGLDGLAVCRAVREHSALPIVMVTARAEEVDRLIGLELGADDYLCKPFSPRELVARVRAILRRCGHHAPAPASPLRIDEAAQRAWAGEAALVLTPSEFRLLAALAGRPGQVFSRQRLLDLANPDGLEVNDRAVDSHIKNLRRKLAAALPGLDPIHSVYGVGYRLEW